MYPLFASVGLGSPVGVGARFKKHRTFKDRLEKAQEALEWIQGATTPYRGTDPEQLEAAYETIDDALTAAMDRA